MKKNLIKVIPSVLILVAMSSWAQVRSDGKWRHPENIRNLCLDIEQNIISVNKQIIERNTAMFNGEVKSNKADYLEVTEASERYLAKTEDRWERLGCVYVLYGTKK